MSVNTMAVSRLDKPLPKKGSYRGRNKPLKSSSSMNPLEMTNVSIHGVCISSLFGIPVWPESGVYAIKGNTMNAAMPMTSPILKFNPVRYIGWPRAPIVDINNKIDVTRRVASRSLATAMPGGFVAVSPSNLRRSSVKRVLTRRANEATKKT